MDVADLELTEEIPYAYITHESIDEIQRLDVTNLSYSQFFNNFLYANKPVILKEATGVWNCAKSWIKGDSLNVEYFRENYGHVEASVSNCEKRWYNIQEKCTMIMTDYLSYWEMYQKDPGDMSCLYLKDWHFTKNFPTQNMYRVPSYFASDWLNEYYDKNKQLDDDFRFVYIGPKGSWTPFHSDVLSSFSWSGNVSGRKKWILLRPGDEEYFRDKSGELKYDINSEIGADNQSKMYEIIQEKGEIIFVPSGWHHQVWNLEDAISVNHNWINGCNIHFVWESLQSNLCDVKKEISDFEGSENWEEDCQRILLASFGFDYYRFYDFLNQIGTVRMEKLRQRQPLVVYGNWSTGRNHMIFDLKQILTVLKLLVEDNDFQSLDPGKMKEDPVRFMNLLDNFLVCEV